MTCCRLAISADQTKAAIGKLPYWWQDQLDKKEGHMRLYDAVDGTSRFVAIYPLRDSTWVNMSWVFPTKKGSESKIVSWNTDGDRDEVSMVFHDFEEDLKKMLR
jgi:salicylate hydroxylase